MKKKLFVKTKQNNEKQKQKPTINQILTLI